mmetsp:Transcript_14093/g.51171  ORF Transcript_14093/g.51171 Transcript_14093/m.51171 type:complete len:224 (-) Transcript_14093:81-752(-)
MAVGAAYPLSWILRRSQGLHAPPARSSSNLRIGGGAKPPLTLICSSLRNRLFSSSRVPARPLAWAALRDLCRTFLLSLRVAFVSPPAFRFREIDPMTAISSSPSASSPSVCDSPKALVFLPLEGRTPASPGLRVSLSRDLFLPVSGSPVSSVVSPKCIKGNGALTSALELPPTWLAFRWKSWMSFAKRRVSNLVPFRKAPKRPSAEFMGGKDDAASPTVRLCP